MQNEFRKPWKKPIICCSRNRRSDQSQEKSLPPNRAATDSVEMNSPKEAILSESRFEDSGSRRMKARGLQEIAEIATPCRPGNLTGRVSNKR
jgi:hypothetical protein